MVLVESEKETPRPLENASKWFYLALLYLDIQLSNRSAWMLFFDFGPEAKIY